MVARNASRVDGKAVQVTKEKGKAQSNGKVKPATEKSILTSTATPEQIHQWVYLDRLSRMIDKNRPQDDPLRRMFYRAMHCPDNHMPAPATLDRLCKHLENDARGRTPCRVQWLAHGVHAPRAGVLGG